MREGNLAAIVHADFAHVRRERVKRLQFLACGCSSELELHQERVVVAAVMTLAGVLTSTAGEVQSWTPDYATRIGATELGPDGESSRSATPTNNPYAAAAQSQRAPRPALAIDGCWSVRKADHARRSADERHPADDLLLLEPQALGREDGVGFRLAVAAQAVHERGELGVADAAGPAIGEMFGDGRIDRLTAALGQVRVEQPFLLEVMRALDHGSPPSRPRSFRAARNRWTRTVDSFSPVMALTSRGVQSP
jgi:hypothetical protein